MITIAGRYGRDSQEFRNYSDALRWLAANNTQHGQRQSLTSFHIGSWRRGRNPGDPAVLDPHGAYWFNRDLWTSEVTPEQYERLAVLHRRYSSYRQYLTEVLPEWRDVETIPYMDNSIEVVQQDKWGNRRTVQTVGPHGDAC